MEKSRRVPWVLGAIVVHIITLMLLLNLGDAFTTVTNGIAVFDLQPPTLDLASHLTAYTPEAKRIYLQFWLIDALYPLSGGLAVAFIWAITFRFGPNRIFQWITDRNLLALTLVVVGFDWLENTTFALTLLTDSLALGQIAILMKVGKLATLYLTLGLTVPVILIAIVSRITKK